MTKLQIGRDSHLPVSILSEFSHQEKAVREASATGEIVLGMNFKSKRRERVYDADKVWSGEHTIQDYTEI
jgi:ketopantoate hydroxymethyltransferase